MKIRKSFVSNSSSSSFIIATKDISVCLDTLPSWAVKVIQKYIDFFKGGSGSYHTKEDFDKYFIERHGWSKAITIESILKNEEGLQEEYEKVISFINKGYIIHDLEVEYDEEWKEDFLSNLPREDDGSGIVLISGDY